MMLHVMIRRNGSWNTYCIWPTNAQNDATDVAMQLRKRYNCQTRVVRADDINSAYKSCGEQQLLSQDLECPDWFGHFSTIWLWFKFFVPHRSYPQDHSFCGSLLHHNNPQLGKSDCPQLEHLRQWCLLKLQAVLQADRPRISLHHFLALLKLQWTAVC